MADRFDPLIPRPLDRPRAVPLAEGADLADLDTAKIFAAPDDPEQWPRWREQVQRWREQARRRHHLDEGVYRRPELAWASRCYVVSQVWLWDELLFDWQSQRFTPERLVSDARQRFGGFDGIVLWHAYPVIGVDERNQWDYYRDVDGLARLVEDLHALGVRVFVDYNPWDTGTRRGADDLTELASLVASLDVDGVFLDTLKEGGADLVAALDRVRPGVALEGESTLALPRLVDHRLSWAQWFADSPTPGVVRTHFYERRHMMHHVRRWHRDHHEELQSAWLNGIGVMVWEAVFGTWVGWSERDADMLRRITAAQRALHHLFVDGDWTPLTDLGAPAAEAGVFGSTFTLSPTGPGADSVNTETIVVLVNRSDRDATIRLPTSRRGEAYDLWLGQPLSTAENELSVVVPGRGVGGVWFAPHGADRSWLRTGPPHAGSPSFQHRSAVRRMPQRSPSTVPGQEHVIVPAGDHVVTVRYRCRETGMYDGAPFVDEWKPLPPRLHDLRTLERQLTVSADVAVAVREVTEKEFALFVATAGHSPATSSGSKPWWVGIDADGCDPVRPITDVDLDDARAYARWRGARLPSEDEWQLAAAEQGWSRCMPAVWNLTESEHSDGRTRFMMLKGGSDYRCEGSGWYFDGGRQDPDFSAKFLIPGLGLARSSQIGFRIAWDLLGATDQPLRTLVWPPSQ